PGSPARPVGWVASPREGGRSPRARRHRGMSERVVPRPMVAALALLPLILTMGCAVLLPFRMGPGGVPRDYALAQSLLREGRADSLLVLVEQGGIQPGDPLLDRLWAGLAAHYAGQDDRATELFEDAHWLIEEHR